MSESEVLYAIRRTDREPIGEFAWIACDGWDAAEEDAEYADEPIEYDRVELTIRVLETRKFPICNEMGCDEAAEHWGLCEPHARIDDPTAFDAIVAPTETDGSE